MEIVNRENQKQKKTYISDVQRKAEILEAVKKRRAGGYSTTPYYLRDDVKGINYSRLKSKLGDLERVGGLTQDALGNYTITEKGEKFLDSYKQAKPLLKIAKEIQTDSQTMGENRESRTRIDYYRNRIGKGDILPKGHINWASLIHKYIENKRTSGMEIINIADLENMVLLEGEGIRGSRIPFNQLTLQKQIIRKIYTDFLYLSSQSLNY